MQNLIVSLLTSELSFTSKIIKVIKASITDSDFLDSSDDSDDVIDVEEFIREKKDL